MGVNMKTIDQAGDTIIEVLFSVAICGLILLGSYFAINHDELEIVYQQQSNQASELVESQIEDLRTYGGSDALSSIVCFILPAGSATVTAETTSTDCNLQSDGDTATAQSDPVYAISITNCGVGPGATCNVNANWTDVYNSAAHVEMLYRPE
jgi:Tfp pilus assembly protein PilV